MELFKCPGSCPECDDNCHHKKPHAHDTGCRGGQCQMGGEKLRKELGLQHTIDDFIRMVKPSEDSGETFFSSYYRSQYRYPGVCKQIGG